MYLCKLERILVVLNYSLNFEKLEAHQLYTENCTCLVTLKGSLLERNMMLGTSLSQYGSPLIYQHCRKQIITREKKKESKILREREKDTKVYKKGILYKLVDFIWILSKKIDVM